jgi:hypothetical protein
VQHESSVVEPECQGLSRVIRDQTDGTAHPLQVGTPRVIGSDAAPQQLDPLDRQAAPFGARSEIDHRLHRKAG